MPRKPRINIEDALHHIIVRGINKESIFLNNRDREDFVERLGRISQEMQTPVYAWVLLPNHFHLLVKNSSMGLSSFMQRLLTGYSISFNKRHSRSGHLFQNRYKSILCEQEPYFLELVRYIHLNPLRAGIVRSLDELENYFWSGHGVLLGKFKNNWQEISPVLLFFGRDREKAVKVYRNFLDVGPEHRHCPVFSGIRTRETGDDREFDERILGTSGFKTGIISGLNENKYQSLPDKKEELERIIEAYCMEKGISVEAVTGKSRAGSLPKLRAILILQLIGKLGISYAEIGRRFGMGTARVSKIVAAKNKIL